MSELWIPIATLISFTVMVIAIVIGNNKNKKEVQLTIRQLLEKGESITPEILEKLGTFKSQKVTDLRRGLALTGIGLACIIAGIVLSEIRSGLAVGIFPLMLGAAFYICWKMNKDEA